MSLTQQYLEENWFTCKISGSLVPCLVSFASSKRRSYCKRVNEQIICLCTSLEENRFTCKISGSLVLWLVSFAFSNEEDEEDLEEEEHGKFEKIMFTCILDLI